MERFDVTIAGELNLDLILYGLPEQLLPERELLVSEMMVTLGSSSAIVAHNLAALGCKVGFSSCIGSDSFGGIALDRLTAAGVDVSTVRQLGPQTRTGLTVILPREEWRNILTYAGTISALNGEHLDRAYLRSSRHFHLSSYYLQSGLQSHVPELLRELKSAGLTPCSARYLPAGPFVLMLPAGEMWSVVTESPSTASTRAPRISVTGAGVFVMPSK